MKNCTKVSGLTGSAVWICFVMLSGCGGASVTSAEGTLTSGNVNINPEEASKKVLFPGEAKNIESSIDVTKVNSNAQKEEQILENSSSVTLDPWIHKKGVPLPEGNVPRQLLSSQGAVYAVVSRSKSPENGLWKLEGDTWSRVAKPLNQYGMGKVTRGTDGKIYMLSAAEGASPLGLFVLEKGNWSSVSQKAAVGTLACEELSFVSSDDAYCASGEYKVSILKLDRKTGAWSDLSPNEKIDAPKRIDDVVVTKQGEVLVRLNNVQAVSGEPLLILRNGKWEPLSLKNNPIQDAMNATGVPYSVINTLGVLPDGETVMMANQQGFFRWNRQAQGTEPVWERFISGWYHNSFFVEAGYLFTNRMGKIERWEGTKHRSVGSVPLGAGCAGAGARNFTTIDGKTLFATLNRDNEGHLGCESKPEIGVYQGQVLEGIPASDLNLDAVTAGYLGGTKSDDVVGSWMLGDGSLVVGMNTRQLAQGTKHISMSLMGETEGPGRLVFLSPDGTSELNTLSLPGRISRLKGSGDIIVAGGTFGVMVFEKQHLKWRKTSLTPLKSVAVTRDANPGQGRVVTLSEDKLIQVFNQQDGTLVSSVKVDRSHVTDVAVSAKQGLVYVVGFDQKDGKTVGQELQVAFLVAHDTEKLGFKWKSWGFDGEKVRAASQTADTRLYGVTLGEDGLLYLVGESAGGDGILRFDGKELFSVDQMKTSPEKFDKWLVRTDLYNDPWATSSAHIAWFGRLNPATGVVQASQYIIPRLISQKNRSNSYRVESGAIWADKRGVVYIGAESAYGIIGRDERLVGGKKVPKYNGDAALFVTSPDFRSRLLWTPVGVGGAIRSIVERDGKVLATGTIYKPEGEGMVVGKPVYQQRFAVEIDPNAPVVLSGANDPADDDGYFILFNAPR